MSSKVNKLVSAYRQHLTVPWQSGLAAIQRVIFAVYDKADELRLRANVDEFALATQQAGKRWLLLDVTNAFPEWMSSHLAKALLKARPDLAHTEADARKLLKEQFPQVTDVTSEQMTNAIEAALAVDGKFPLTLVVLDEVQQYIGADAEKAFQVQEVTETLSKHFNGKLLFVGTGQSALSGMPNLQRLMGRFPVQVMLGDWDVENVTRQIILAKKPSAQPEVEHVWRANLGEISRHLRGTKLEHVTDDEDVMTSDQALQHLVWEVAYEHWHRMLFARFLAENGLLLWEPGAAVSLDDCEALVQEADPAMNLGAKTKWELAGKLAARMLPQVFKPQSPVFELAFAPEHQRELERLLGALPPDVFKASDSLGWVYQFWQAKRKDEVNASEVKIGADELPAVTQLFTEPYMVDFLLHNSLGAWWVTRHPGQTCPVPLTYLRTLDDGTPAAGKFEGWPNRLDEFKLLDPCCGSGHFLVAAFLLLVPMRMAAEGLSAMDAVDAVLANNLHGLELDARCVEIAVFALALAAWRFLLRGVDASPARSPTEKSTLLREVQLASLSQSGQLRNPDRRRMVG